MSKISIRRINKAVHFEGVNENGNTISLDGSPKIGGEDKGVRPMELLLFGVAGCSSIDIVSFLGKMKQDLQDLRVEVEGRREEGAIPAVFVGIHVHYYLYGEIKREKAVQAIELSLDKYCSVSKMLDKVAEITYDLTINPEE
ncbi:MAG: OsmC family protein [Bacteroidota bacterium]